MHSTNSKTKKKNRKKSNKIGKDETCEKEIENKLKKEKQSKQYLKLTSAN
ncbi:hypothetical protein HYD82_00835 [Mycoplasmopsis bovis]|nr:hypothetical protein [Mycoplasmopsis bovis]QQH37485.1 hypothetical protein HYD82_00835 [Mycoplasmopsis bovis]